MALFLCANPLTTSLHSSSLSFSCFPATLLTSPSSVLNMKSKKKLHPGYITPLEVNKTVSASVIVKAASGIDGTGPTDSVGPEPTSESKEAVVPLENLPLESKVKEREEQKLTMKLAKKIRLRRKRLVRKRRLRKKGRWPPSKMNKLKNV